MANTQTAVQTDPVDEARSRLSKASDDLNLAQAEWNANRFALDNHDQAGPRDKANPAWHLERTRIDAQIDTLAETLVEARREHSEASADLEAILRADFNEKSPVWNSRLHEIAQTLDEAFESIAPLLSEALHIEAEAFTSKRAASITGPDPLKRQRALASVVVAKLPLFELKRTEWSQNFRLNRFVDLYPEPSEAELVEVGS